MAGVAAVGGVALSAMGVMKEDGEAFEEEPLEGDAAASSAEADREVSARAGVSPPPWDH